MHRQLTYLFFFTLTISMLTACAQSKKAKSKGTGEAYAKSFGVGTHKADNTPTRYSFHIVWKKRETPEAFYWRGEDGWTDCTVKKVHGTPDKTGSNGSLISQGIKFSTEPIGLDKIKPGDSLEIFTVPGGKNVIPSEIPGNAKNRLYFKTANTGWLYIYPKTIK